MFIIILNGAMCGRNGALYKIQQPDFTLLTLYSSDRRLFHKFSDNLFNSTNKMNDFQSKK